MTSFSLWLFEFVTLNWIFGVHWVATSLKLFLLQIYNFILKFIHKHITEIVCSDRDLVEILIFGIGIRIEFSELLDWEWGWILKIWDGEED